LSSTVSLNVECLHLVKNRYSNEWLWLILKIY
jgi:hypothetical protein